MHLDPYYFSFIQLETTSLKVSQDIGAEVQLFEKTMKSLQKQHTSNENTNGTNFIIY